MKFYLLSARAEEAQKAAAFGFVAGAVVPRGEVARTGRDYGDLIAEWGRLPFALVGAEAEAADADALVRDAAVWARGSGAPVSLFTPLTLESLKACARLSGLGVRLAAQFAASPLQALVAARAGAGAVCVHARRLGACGLDAVGLVRQTRELFARAGLSADILVDEAADAAELERFALAGADGALCPWELLRTLAYHPFTDRGIERLLAEVES